VQKDWLFTLLSFINVSKVSAFSAFYFNHAQLRVHVFICGGEFEVSGKTCFVFMGCAIVYLLHFYLIHITAQVVFLIQGFAWSDFLFEPFSLETGSSVRSWVGVVFTVFNFVSYLKGLNDVSLYLSCLSPIC